MFIMIDCNINQEEKRKKIDQMGIDAFGAWVLLAVWVREHGDANGNYHYRSRSNLCSIFCSKNYSKMYRILSQLKAQNWIKIDTVKRTIQIPKFLKYQRLLPSKAFQNRTSRFDPPAFQNRTSRFATEKKENNKETNLLSFHKFKYNKLVPDEDFVENSTAKPPSESRQLTDWIKDRCPTLVVKHPEMYQWALSMRKHKNYNPQHIRATCLYLDQKLTAGGVDSKTVDDLSEQMEGIWGLACNCLNDRYAGMMEIAKQLDREDADYLGSIVQIAEEQRDNS